MEITVLLGRRGRESVGPGAEATEDEEVGSKTPIWSRKRVE